MGLALRHSIATAASGARAPMLASRPILPYLLKDRKVRCCCCRLPRALTTTLVRLAVPLVATLLVAAYLFHSQWRSDEPSPSHHSARLNSTIQRSVDSSVGDAGSIDALSLEEHAAVMERQWDGRSHVADDAAVAPLGALQHVVIVTAGLQGAVLGGGIGTAYSALARRLAAAGHTVQVLYVPYPSQHSASVINRTELTAFYPSSVRVDQLLVSRHSTLLSRLLPPSTEQSVLQTPARGCSYACARSYQVYRWLGAHLRRLSERGECCPRGVVVHVQDNSGLGYFVSQAHTQRLLPASITLVVGSHAPHLWERMANGVSIIGAEDAELDWLERATAANADWLISPSHYMVDWMRQQGWLFPPHVAVQVNLLPQPPTDAQIDQRARDMLDLSAPQPLYEIVFFGRLEVRKGLFIFLDALQLLFGDGVGGAKAVAQWSDVKLIISFLGPDTHSELPEAGWMSQTAIARCHTLREQLRATVDVRCVAFTNLSRQATLAYLSRHPQPPPLVIISSPIDNSPYTVLECLTLGVPFLAADVGGIPELLHHHLQPHDAQQRLFQPTARHLAGKLRQAAFDGVSWLPMVGQKQNEWVWQRWHRALRPATASVAASVSASLADGPRLLLSVCVVYTGSLLELRSQLSAVIEQDKLAAYELQLVLVRPLDEQSSANGVGESDATSASIRSEMAAAGIGKEWSTQLLTVPAVVAKSADVLSYWQWVDSHIDSDYYLFLHTQHTLYDPRSLELLLRAAVRSGAGLTAGLVYDAVQGHVVLDLGCSHSAAPSSAANCFATRSLLVRQSDLQRAHSSGEGLEGEIGIGGENEGEHQERRLRALSSLVVPELLFVTRAK